MGALGVAALLLPDAQAQVASSALPHGCQVALALKGGHKIEGTVVRTDPDAVYVRTAPGNVPEKVRLADVSKAAPKGPKGKPRPEIHQVEVVNGVERTVKYIAPTLSPSERTRLAELEAAENEVAQWHAAVVLPLRPPSDRDVEAARRLAYYNFYKYSAASSFGFFPATSIGGTLAYNPPGYFGAGWPYDWSGYWGAYGGYGLGSGAPFAYSSLGGLTTIPAVSPALAGNYQPAAKAAPQKMPPAKDAVKALAAARAKLARLRSQAIYEGGRLVALRPEVAADKAVAMPSAD
jgi:hypothetical protein